MIDCRVWNISSDLNPQDDHPGGVVLIRQDFGLAVKPATTS
jgi:hypothetical protein